jgi:hypothetical protein
MLSYKDYKRLKPWARRCYDIYVSFILSVLIVFLTLTLLIGLDVLINGR